MASQPPSDPSQPPAQSSPLSPWAKQWNNCDQEQHWEYLRSPTAKHYSEVRHESTLTPSPAFDAQGSFAIPRNRRRGRLLLPRRAGQDGTEADYGADEGDWEA